MSTDSILTVKSSTDSILTVKSLKGVKDLIYETLPTNLIPKEENYFADANIHVIRSREELEKALSFAKERLKIKADIFQSYILHPYSTYNFWYAKYAPDIRKMEFNGFPCYEAVFHEATHLWQHENGRDFSEYKNMACLYDYFRSQAETEARFSSYMLMIEYLPMIGRELPVFKVLRDKST